jgi:hypothetical protein
MVTTEDVLAVVARSPHNWGNGRYGWLAEEMAKLGASDGDLAAAALAGLDSDDRNVRVRAVWALSVIPGSQATEGVLRALRDPARRVREVAMKATSPHHVGSPEIMSELRRIADDEREIDRLRRGAVGVLTSVRTRDALPDIAADSLRELMGSQQFRAGILRLLCTARGHAVDDAGRATLQEFVRTGTKEEAVMATRALCGQVLVSVNRWLAPEVRQRLQAQYDAGPRSDYTETVWMPVADMLELARETGWPHDPAELRPSP